LFSVWSIVERERSDLCGDDAKDRQDDDRESREQEEPGKDACRSNCDDGGYALRARDLVNGDERDCPTLCGARPSC
jgi:hypothetical protein